MFYVHVPKFVDNFFFARGAYVASSGQFVIEIDVKSRENKEVDEDLKIQCFQTPHTPTQGTQNFVATIF